MALTEEDRRRIYEEEKTRIEARNQIKGENTPYHILGALLGLILLAIVLYIQHQTTDTHPSWWEILKRRFG